MDSYQQIRYINTPHICPRILFHIPTLFLRYLTIPENVSFLLQKELPDVMRQGIDEIIQFDKKPEEKMRVYAYENAVKRCYTY